MRADGLLQVCGDGTARPESRDGASDLAGEEIQVNFAFSVKEKSVLPLAGVEPVMLYCRAARQHIAPFDETRRPRGQDYTYLNHMKPLFSASVQFSISSVKR